MSREPTVTEWNRLKSIQARILDLRRKGTEADVISHVKEELKTTADTLERLCLLTELTTAYQIIDEPGKAEAAIHEQISLAPDDPIIRTTLAEHYHYFQGDHAKALGVIENAIEMAIGQGQFVRALHGVRIRIALKLKDYGVIENSLRTLLQYKPEVGSDVVLEDDFVDRIPLNVISGDLLNRYREAAKAEKKRVSEARIRRDSSNESR